MTADAYPVTSEPLPDGVTKQHGLLWRAGTSQVVSCQCKAQPDPCAHMTTQEDGLCDHCRAGCGLIRIPGAGSVHADKTGELDCSERIRALLGTIPAEGGAIYPDPGIYRTRGNV